MKKYLITALFIFISITIFGQAAKVPMGIHMTPANAFPIINNAIDTLNKVSDSVKTKAPIHNAHFTGLTLLEQLKISSSGVVITAITSDGSNIHFWAGTTELAAVPGIGGAVWGQLTGSMAAQSDLTSALNAKAPVSTTMTTSHAANVITSTDLAHYASAYGWGNHASAGYALNSALANYALNSALAGYVPTSRTINGHSQSSNITINASDVGAVATADIASYRLLNNHDSLNTLQEKAYGSLSGKPTLGTAAAQDVGYFATASHNQAQTTITALPDSLLNHYTKAQSNAKYGTGSGTITSIATGLGLSGGTISTTGTILVDTASASILSRQRAVKEYQAKSSYLDPTSSIQGQLNAKVGIYPIYYISPSGSDAANGLTTVTAWQTINKVNTSTFVAGSKILFEKGGTWREQLEIPSSGTADAYITFGSYGTNPLDAPPRIIGSTHAITWTNTSGNIWESATTLNEPYLTDTDPHGNIYFIGTNNGVTVGARKTYSGGYGNLVAEYDWTWNANKIYVYSATDPDTRYSSIEAAQRLHAFHLEGKEYITIDGINMFYTQTTGVWEAYPTTNKTGLIVRNCEIAYIGYPAGDGFGTHVSYNNALYEYNIIHDCGRRGISLNNYSNNIIQNTTIQNNIFYNGNHTTSMDIATGTGGYNNVIIRSNLIYDPSSATRSSIQMYANAAGGTLTNLYIYNNIFKNPSPESLRFNGHIASAYVYNNTFYQQATYSYTGDAHFIEIDDAYSTGSNTITIKNNIFYSLLATDSGGAGVGIYSEPAQNYALLTVDYNMYYRTGTLRVISANSTAYHMDDKATIISGLGWETDGPAFADPAFTTDGYDFSLQSTSTCIDAGINVGISNDFYGYKRVRITDIGAIERQAIKQ